jgi:hypothetical protein
MEITHVETTQSIGRSLGSGRTGIAPGCATAYCHARSAAADRSEAGRSATEILGRPQQGHHADRQEWDDAVRLRKRAAGEGIQPNDVVGTYQYDSGKFSGVVYTDGRYIKASYAPNGALLGLTSDTSAQVKFRVKNKPNRAASFMAIQNGIAALRNPGAANYCVGTDDDATCTIIIEDSPQPEDWGGGGGFGGGVDVGLPD